MYITVSSQLHRIAKVVRRSAIKKKKSTLIIRKGMKCIVEREVHYGSLRLAVGQCAHTRGWLSNYPEIDCGRLL